MRLRETKGFTLVELVIVIGIISVLSTVTFAAVKPNERFGAARNAQRYISVRSLADAIESYALDTGALPSAITTTQTEICKHDL